MTAAKHTPGPWFVEPSPPSPHVPSRIFIRAQLEGRAPYWLASTDSNPANAALIAAAPDMLAALEEIAALHVPDQPDTSDVDDYTWALQHVARLRRIALAAIAKARGA